MLAAGLAFLQLGYTRLCGQALVATGANAGTYNFSASYGLVNTKPLWEGDANFNSSSGGTSTLDIANGTYVSFAAGTFSNGTTSFSKSDGRTIALQVTYTIFADNGDAGAVAIIFDTQRDGVIGTGDKGFAFNQSWASNKSYSTGGTATQAFSLAVGSSAAYTPSNISFTSTAINSGATLSDGRSPVSNYYYQQVGNTAGNPANTTNSFAFLLSDLDSTLAGTNVMFTVFTMPTIAAAGTFTASSGSLLDLYGSSNASTANFTTSNGAGTVLIPEPSTLVWSGTLVCSTALCGWRRLWRRKTTRA